jgi:hypothetical protein
VLLQSLKLAVLDVTQATMNSDPEAFAAYPETPDGSTAGLALITSVVAPPVAVAVIALEHAPLVTVGVPIAVLPAATVCAIVALPTADPIVTPFSEVELERAAGRSAAAIVPSVRVAPFVDPCFA